MLDHVRLRTELDAAIERFVTRMTALVDAELTRRRADEVSSSTPPRPTRRPAPVPTVDRESGPPIAMEPPRSSRPRPLASRPNLFRMPAGVSLPPRPSTPAQVPEAAVHVGPTQEEIADGALKAVLGAGGPPTFDQVRARVRVSRDALRPVLDRLAADGKLRVVEQDGKVVYKAPRIEPIKRVRGPLPRQD